MIELWCIKPTERLELVVEGQVTWEGKRYQAPRKIQATIVTKQGNQKYYTVEEGDTVQFKWKGKELFRGTVFSRIPRDNTLFFEAFDMLTYLVRNQDVYVFSNQRADQIIHRICNDFQITKGTIANTGSVLKSLVITQDTSLYDIILKALKQTRSNNGRNFQLYSSGGKLGLRAWPDPSEVWVVEKGVNLISYEYSTSIEETATRVKLKMQKDDKTYTATARDNAGANKFGVLQYTENVSDDLNQAQLQRRADNKQKELKGVKKKLSGVQAVGIPDVTSGLPVRIVIKDLNINRNYWVDSDSHSFQGSTHKMTLDLVETNKIPEVS
ncbi:XkdQ/YqbQ family protein [Shouchella clausii]|uniref:XkdQ/YqbQ family protein n=1 Tax=Shouchella clausii TaxID=79880 RepID=UPI001C72CCCF|nr:phage portal protein [Shouchella clausii]